ncbi:DUF4249 domain-containing protein [Parapedobacter koreensis]|uniref:DUF4249 domain-containing protein n=1 Tax=Parapedobacter koreensis TaxID=332977 RepID=A0A1H7IPX2_9SPHI|nr:DUF4249 domain-containing protein [Parapedobacter koreensis]SEK64553.1 protein of unknown function [Parapedobacter koreensis]
MRRYCTPIFLIVGFLWSSCEDVIDINLNDANPQLVIIGEVSNQTNRQQVTIGRTVAFGSDNPFDPVSGADVEVLTGSGQVFHFDEQEPGIYVADHFRGRENEWYELHVRVDGVLFTAVSTMPPLVIADSIGTSIRNLFGEEEKLITLKFQDPPFMPNYYRYLWSVNGAPFEMVHLAQDKFNDGKYVSEDLIDFDIELVTGDSVMVQMQCIDKATFDFWNAVESTNPGSAAPANPPAAFGIGALGYFSACAMSEIATVVQ